MTDFMPEDMIRLRDFDALGMFELDNNFEIEDLVTPKSDGKFISRSNAFYERRSCSGASEFREELKSILQNVSGKKQFVVLDYMANLSGKAYYAHVEKAIEKGDYSGLDKAKQCLTEDIQNVVNAIENKPVIIPESVLPRGKELIPDRAIELDNMGLLYVFTKNFDMPEGYNILNAGLGGIHIGPFFKVMHGTEWTNLLKSKYIKNDTSDESGRGTLDSIVDRSVFDKKRVLFLDDNIGTGKTVYDIRDDLTKAYFKTIARKNINLSDGKHQTHPPIKIGAVQYNWMNYYRVYINEKQQERFIPENIDYVTAFNLPGHKLAKHAIAMLCGQRDLEGNEPSRDPVTPWGQIYSDYLEHKKHYKDAGIPGIAKLQQKGENWVNNSDNTILNFGAAGGLESFNFTDTSKELIDRIADYISVICFHGYGDYAEEQKYIKKLEEAVARKKNLGEGPQPQ